MASHVSTCIEHEIAIQRSSQAVRRGREQQEGKIKKKKGEEKRGKRERKSKEREREGEERKRKKEKRKAMFRRLELVRVRSKVRIFDESCVPRGRDSSYLGFFLSFELFFWSAFGTTLCHVYGIFCSINWNMAHFTIPIETML